MHPGSSNGRRVSWRQLLAGSPVDHHAHRWRDGIGQRIHQQESATVRANIEEPRDALPRCKKCMRWPCLECRTCLDGAYHEFTIGCDVEELLAIATPHGAAASADRHPPLLAGGWERLNVDLILPGLIGGVRQPVDIG